MSEIRQDDPSSSVSETSSPLAAHLSSEIDPPQANTQEEPNAERKSKPATHKGAMVTVEYKHSLATRWMHWINLPLLFVMIYSGTLI